MTEEDLLNRGLPKWPQMVVTGARLSEERALEVIRRTDSWFVSGSGCNDRDGDRRLARRFRMPHYQDYSERRPENFDWRAHWDRCEHWKRAWGTIETNYVRNKWIGSAFIHGPHGWCHPDGQIHYIDNVGKWPTIAEIREDWRALATAFPFLRLTVTLMDGESCEDGTRAVVSMTVADGRRCLGTRTTRCIARYRGRMRGGVAAASNEMHKTWDEIATNGGRMTALWLSGRASTTGEAIRARRLAAHRVVDVG